jgi:hypothetical protein
MMAARTELSAATSEANDAHAALQTAEEEFLKTA